MDEEENLQISDDAQQIKKPVPLPRKTISNKMNSISENSIYANSESNVPIIEPEVKETPGRRISRSFRDKIQFKSVPNLEKSWKRMIPKRRSITPKELTIDAGSSSVRCHSLPEHDIFQKISFNSPFDLNSLQRVQLVSKEESEDSSSESDTFYLSSEEPPSYPPPPLPDESTYDSVSSEGPNSYYSPGSDSASIYEELSNYLSLSAPKPCSTVSTQDPPRSNSWAFYDQANGTSGSRYEEIEDVPASPVLVPEKSVSTIEPPDPEPVKLSQRSTVVMQFDPLLEDEKSSKWAGIVRNFGEESSGKNPFEDPVIMSFLCDDKNENNLYGTINKKHQSVLSDCENLNFELPTVVGPPPVPPRRFDSVPTTSDSADAVATVSEKEGEKRSSIIRWSSMKKVAKFVADNIEHSALGRRNERKGLLDTSLVEENNANAQVENRTSLSSLYSNEETYVPLVLHHSGLLYRPGGIKRWGVLAQRKLTIFTNKDSPDVKETISIDSVLSLRICTESKISVEGEQICCFEVSLSNKSQTFLLGAPSPSDRHMWMRKILESITHAFPAKLSLDYSKAGWCYLKEGISSGWCLSSVLLCQRSLHLVPSNGTLLTLDLRKARAISLQEGDMKCKKATEKGPVLLLDVQERTLYLQMDTSAETAAWEAAVRSAALQNGPALAQQQLTKDDVPTIVDKAINFVHTHGSATEGIYRRSGSNSAVAKLVSAFRRDAWAVQISRSEYSEFEVSSVLKRFFRDLPEPLFITEIHAQLRDVVENGTLSLAEKATNYKQILKQLPNVNYVTARRLMGHLYFIDKLKAKNFMPVENLSAIWGPTLMHVQEGTSLDPQWSRVESTVISDLISNFPIIFDVTQEELDRELKILDVLENYHANSISVPNAKKPSGDLKVWVYLNSQKDGDCVSVAVPPGKLAREMCDELSSRMSLPGYALCLKEVVSGGQLSRPLHHTECVLDAILRWGQWPEEDRRDNCLVLTPATFLQELVPLASAALLPVVEELKFADAKSKNFKSHLFELSQTTLCCYKDKSCSTKLREWKISDIVWYLGHESKRNPHTGWSMTFITPDSQPTRSKDKPFFGNTLCGNTELQKRKWMAAMLIAVHPAGIIAPPILIE